MIDLHIHSTHSDGTMTPAELVRMAALKNLRAVSITDHDTVTGTEEALLEGDIQGVSVISGVELSVYHNETYFHLLGYDFDWCERNLICGLERLQISRAERNFEILEKLKGVGINITRNDLDSVSGGGQAGRPHIARILQKKKIVQTLDQAFARYLRKGCFAYVSRFIFPVEEAINLIRGAGGLAVLAHPVQLGYSLDILPSLLEQLKLFGLAGIESYYPTQKGKIRQKLSILAKKFDLLETGGSDYHGDIRPGTTLAGGKKFLVPEELFTRLKKRQC